MSKWCGLIVSFLLGMCLLACGSSAEETPTATPTRTLPPPAAGSCGDGVCDEAEQANTNLCPQDCQKVARTQPPPGGPAPTETATPTPTIEARLPSPTPTDTPTPTLTVVLPPAATATIGTATPAPCAVEEWRLHIRGVVRHQDSEPSAYINSKIDGCVTVDPPCAIAGTGSGVYTQRDCALTSLTGICSYEVTCPDFPVSFGGEKVGNTLRVRLGASQIWEQVVMHCPPAAPMPIQGHWLQDGYGSAIRNGGGYFCEIEAKEGAHVWVEGGDTVAPGLSYGFEVFLYAGCQ